MVQPAWRYKRSFERAVKELESESDRVTVTPEVKNFTHYLRRWKMLHTGKDLPKGIVPRSDFWLVDGEQYIGMVQIRHRLNRRLCRTGGHIYYEIRPSARNKGYGTTLLRLAKSKARKLGIKTLLVTCDEGNLPSRKVILANGGICYRCSTIHGEHKRILQFLVRTEDASTETP